MANVGRKALARAAKMAGARPPKRAKGKPKNKTRTRRTIRKEAIQRNKKAERFSSKPAPNKVCQTRLVMAGAKEGGKG